ncbi:probable RNA helicase armi [Lutzomyia longipalpis]|uniref:RNA helicase n=1 Tax=Lutzomyia longipalpis TaxID=7200 RepID=A0A1B0GII5_LUTLO|nr:probable RNA helicase armi [Lutzomyia longipalpis]
MNTLEMVLDLAFSHYLRTRPEYAQKKLEEALKKLEGPDDDDAERREEEEREKRYREELKRSGECVKKQGWVTKLLPSYGVIDNNFRFEIDLIKEFTNFAEGCRVSYLAYKQPDGIVKVVKIDSVLQEAWERGNFNEQKIFEQNLEEFYGTHLRKINGTVESLVESHGSTMVNIETEVERNVTINISTVEIQFRPMAGDTIILTCKMQTDDQFFDYRGAILNCVSITPVRSIVDIGTVSRVDPSGGGRINKNISFSRDALEPDYVPQMGDVVTYDAIENIKEETNWRCLKLVLTKRPELLQSDDKPPEQQQPVPKDERGIVVDDIQQIFLEDVEQKAELDIRIRNTSARSHKLFRLIIPVAKKFSQLELLSPTVDTSFVLEPGQGQTYKFLVKGRFYGLSSEKLVWKFAGGLHVERQVEIQVGTDDKEVQHRPQRPSRYNNGYVREFGRTDADVVRGGALRKTTGIMPKVIGQYLVPDNIKELVLGASNRIDAEDGVLRAYPVLKNPLEPRTYSRFFHNLLFLEELQMWVDFRVYDRTEVFFKRPEKDYLSLDIDNVAETRPSLILGDIIRATNPWNTRQVFEGHVHKIQQNRVLVKFDKSFQYNYRGELYNVQFHYTRGQIRKLHHAVEKVLEQLGEEVIFPVKITPKTPQVDVVLNDERMIDQKTGQELKWFNEKLNESQKRAIKNILRGEARPMPYVIFGPPGTGKTYTVLEAILQIVQNIPHARVLVSASSNSACNLITERLIGCKALLPGTFIRVVGLSAIDRQSIPEHLHAYCALCDISIDGTTSNEVKETETGLKMYCNSKYLAEHKVIIGTCATLGSFMSLNLKSNHFTHVILDEAGQCNEPETIIPMSLLNMEMGQIILAGDPRQLGPQVTSPIAKNHGLCVSFLDRILERFPYEKNYERHKYGFDERLVTQLIYNYRSLPSVLKLYSDLFYDGKLIPTIAEEGTPEIAFLQKFRPILSDEADPNHGVFFFSIAGENRQDPDSPSWYNPFEARNINSLLKKLYSMGIEHSDIGIITPYQAQVKRIRLFLYQIDPEKCPKVGSVEEFQGQERNIIILSTVRSSKNFLAHDFKYSMGFVQNNKRLNVAISRAKSLLIIFGNAFLLANDPNWCKLIRYCAERNAFTGPLPPQVVLPEVSEE